MCTIPSISNPFVVLWMSSPLNLFHLCFLLPILFLSFCSTTSYYFFITCGDITSSVKPSFTLLGCILQSLDTCSYYCCNIYASYRRRQVYWGQGYISVHFCGPWIQNFLTQSGLLTNIPWTNRWIAISKNKTNQKVKRTFIELVLMDSFNILKI